MPIATALVSKLISLKNKRIKTFLYSPVNLWYPVAIFLRLFSHSKELWINIDLPIYIDVKRDSYSCAVVSGECTALICIKYMSDLKLMFQKPNTICADQLALFDGVKLTLVEHTAKLNYKLTRRIAVHCNLVYVARVYFRLCFCSAWLANCVEEIVYKTAHALKMYWYYFLM